MNPNTETERNEIGRRIARHAASYCINHLDFRTATLIAHAWGVPYCGVFIDGCPNPYCWHNTQP